MIDGPTIAETLYEILNDGPFSAEAAELLSNEVKQATNLSDAEKKCVLELVARSVENPTCDESKALLRAELLRHESVQNEFSKIVAQKLMGLRE